MFWKQLKAFLAPLGVALLVILFAGFSWNPFGTESGAFVWEVILGAAFGLLLGLLPIVQEDGSRPRFVSQRWFACGVLAFVLLYQYLHAFDGVNIPWLNWLAGAYGRKILLEGAVLGYSVLGAARARR